MFKALRSKAEERFEFKFRFHATRVPAEGAEKLLIVLCHEKDKKETPTAKAHVKGEVCQWTGTVAETVKLTWNKKTGAFEPRPLKLVVTSASTKTGVLGEASLDLSEFVAHSQLDQRSLPLKFCQAGTVLHVTVQSTPLDVAPEEEEVYEDEGPLDDYDSEEEDDEYEYNTPYVPPSLDVTAGEQDAATRLALLRCSAIAPAQSSASESSGMEPPANPTLHLASASAEIERTRNSSSASGDDDAAAATPFYKRALVQRNRALAAAKREAAVVATSRSVSDVDSVSGFSDNLGAHADADAALLTPSGLTTPSVSSTPRASGGVALTGDALARALNAQRSNDGAPAFLMPPVVLPPAAKLDPGAEAVEDETKKKSGWGGLTRPAGLRPIGVRAPSPMRSMRGASAVPESPRAGRTPRGPAAMLAAVAGAALTRVDSMTRRDSAGAPGASTPRAAQFGGHNVVLAPRSAAASATASASVAAVAPAASQSAEAATTKPNAGDSTPTPAPAAPAASVSSSLPPAALAASAAFAAKTRGSHVGTGEDDTTGTREPGTATAVVERSRSAGRGRNGSSAAGLSSDPTEAAQGDTNLASSLKAAANASPARRRAGAGLLGLFPSRTRDASPVPARPQKAGQADAGPSVSKFTDAPNEVAAPLGLLARARKPAPSKEKSDAQSGAAVPPTESAEANEADAEAPERAASAVPAPSQALAAESGSGIGAVQAPAGAGTVAVAPSDAATVAAGDWLVEESPNGTTMTLGPTKSLFSNAPSSTESATEPQAGLAGASAEGTTPLVASASAPAQHRLGLWATRKKGAAAPVPTSEPKLTTLEEQTAGAIDAGTTRNEDEVSAPEPAPAPPAFQQEPLQGTGWGSGAEDATGAYVPQWRLDGDSDASSGCRSSTRGKAAAEESAWDAQSVSSVESRSTAASSTPSRDPVARPGEEHRQMGWWLGRRAAKNATGSVSSTDSAGARDNASNAGSARSRDQATMSLPAIAAAAAAAASPARSAQQESNHDEDRSIGGELGAGNSRSPGMGSTADELLAAEFVPDEPNRLGATGTRSHSSSSSSSHSSSASSASGGSTAAGSSRFTASGSAWAAPSQSSRAGPSPHVPGWAGRIGSSRGERTLEAPDAGAEPAASDPAVEQQQLNDNLSEPLLQPVVAGPPRPLPPGPTEEDPESAADPTAPMKPTQSSRPAALTQLEPLAPPGSMSAVPVPVAAVRAFRVSPPPSVPAATPEPELPAAGNAPVSMTAAALTAGTVSLAATMSTAVFPSPSVATSALAPTASAPPASFDAASVAHSGPAGTERSIEDLQKELMEYKMALLAMGELPPGVEGLVDGFGPLTSPPEAQLEAHAHLQHTAALHQVESMGAYGPALGGEEAAAMGLHLDPGMARGMHGEEDLAQVEGMLYGPMGGVGLGEMGMGEMDMGVHGEAMGMGMEGMQAEMMGYNAQMLGMGMGHLNPLNMGMPLNMPGLGDMAGPEGSVVDGMQHDSMGYAMGLPDIAAPEGSLVDGLPAGMMGYGMGDMALAEGSIVDGLQHDPMAFSIPHGGSMGDMASMGELQHEVLEYQMTVSGLTKEVEALQMQLAEAMTSEQEARAYAARLEDQMRLLQLAHNQSTAAASAEKASEAGGGYGAAGGASSTTGSLSMPPGGGPGPFGSAHQAFPDEAVLMEMTATEPSAWDAVLRLVEDSRVHREAADHLRVQVDELMTANDVLANNAAELEQEMEERRLQIEALEDELQRTQQEMEEKEAEWQDYMNKDEADPREDECSAHGSHWGSEGGHSWSKQGSNAERDDRRAERHEEGLLRKMMRAREEPELLEAKVKALEKETEDLTAESLELASDLSDTKKQVAFRDARIKELEDELHMIVHPGSNSGRLRASGTLAGGDIAPTQGLSATLSTPARRRGLGSSAASAESLATEEGSIRRRHRRVNPGHEDEDNDGTAPMSRSRSVMGRLEGTERGSMEEAAEEEAEGGRTGRGAASAGDKGEAEGEDASAASLRDRPSSLPNSLPRKKSVDGGLDKAGSGVDDQVRQLKSQLRLAEMASQRASERIRILEMHEARVKDLEKELNANKLKLRGLKQTDEEAQSKLKQEVQNLTQVKGELTKQLEGFVEENKALTEHKEKLEEEKKALSLKLAELYGKTKELQDAAAALADEKMELIAQVHELEGAQKRVKAELEAAQKESIELRASVDKADASRRAVESRSGALQQLRMELDAKAAETKRLLGAADERRRVADEARVRAEEERDMAEARWKQLEEVVKKVEGERNSAREHVRHLEKSVGVLQQEIGEHYAQIQAARAAFDESQKAVAAAKREAHELRVEWEAARRFKAEGDERLHDSQRQLQGVKEERIALEAQLKGTVEHWQRQADSLLAEKGRLEVELKEAVHRGDEALEALRAEKASLEGELREALRSSGRLADDLKERKGVLEAELRAAQDAAHKWQAKAHELEGALRAVQAELHELRAEADMIRSRDEGEQGMFSDLEARVVRQDVAISTLESRVRQEQDAKRKLQERAVEMEAQLVVMTNELGMKALALKDAEKHLEEAQGRLEIQVERQKMVEDRVAQLEADKAVLEEKVQQEEEEKVAVAERCVVAEMQLQEVREKASKESTEMREMEGKLFRRMEVLLSEKEETVMKATRLEDMLRKERTEKGNLRSEMGMLKQQLATMGQAGSLGSRGTRGGAKGSAGSNEDYQQLVLQCAKLEAQKLDLEERVKRAEESNWQVQQEQERALREMDARIQALQVERNALRAKEIGLVAELQVARQGAGVSQEIAQELLRAKEEKVQIALQLDAARRQIETLEKTRQGLESEKRALLGQQGLLASKAKEVEKLKADLQQARGERQVLEERRLTLAVRLGEFEERMEELTELRKRNQILQEEVLNLMKQVERRKR